MKKILTIVLLIVAMAMCSIGLVACGDGNGEGEKGLLTIKYSGDDYYTVVRFVAEDDATVLDLGAEVGSGVKIGRIKAGAFSGNNTIKELIVPDTVEVIDEGAFAGMQKLEKITLPFIGRTAKADGTLGESGASDKSVDSKRNFGYVFGTSSYNYGTSIAQNYNANSTETYYFPLSLKEVTIKPAEDYAIPAYAFHGVNILRSVVLSEKVVSLGDYSFTNCTSLKTVSYISADSVEVGLSASVNYLGESAFSGCNNLSDTGFKFNDSNAVTELKKETFKGAGLSVVVVPTNVTKIGEGCFRESAVSSVTIATSTAIGISAFNGCQELSKLNSANANELDFTGFSEVGAFAFANLNEGVTFTVVSAPTNVDEVMWNTNRA